MNLSSKRLGGRFSVDMWCPRAKIIIISSMKLYEYQGKELFKKYGINVPKGELINLGETGDISGSAVLKAQVLSGDRKKGGGIIFVKEGEAASGVAKLLGSKLNGEIINSVLVEEMVDIQAEYYASISYDTSVRGPVLALNTVGGTGISAAKTYPLDITQSVIPEAELVKYLLDAGFAETDIKELVGIIQNLWKLFVTEYALLAEINPIFKTKDGKFIAGDSKVIIDDEKVNPNERRFISMGGDIAILASGGGASMLNMDSLLKYGGKPANYAEYSGNPKADIVKTLTKKVLEQQGINALWVIGGTANFTDIYETMSGFIDGLQSLSEKPQYPILIRRDGPRQKEAEEMLRNFAKEKGYDMHIYGRELPMEESARMIVELANLYKQKKS